jgi:putative flippase GtrA
MNLLLITLRRWQAFRRPRYQLGKSKLLQAITLSHGKHWGFDINQFLFFLLVGSTSAVLTILIRALLNTLIAFEAAVAISQVFGMTFAFILNRFFVFRGYKGGLLVAYSRFMFVNIWSLIIVTVVSSGLYRFIFVLVPVGSYADYLAHFLGLAATAIPSYFGHRLFSFRS